MQIEQELFSGMSSYLICFTQYADHPSFSRQHSTWYPNISMTFSKKAIHLVGPSSSYDISLERVCFLFFTLGALYLVSVVVL
jgi:cytochrome b subunit of formate dehydrogenase